MPFEKIDIQLTGEQLEQLKPFADQIRAGNGTVIAEMFIISTDSRYQTARVRLLDSPSVIPVSQALINAEKAYDARLDKRRRFKEIQDALLRSLPGVTLGDGVLTVEQDGHKYELREVPEQ